MFLRIFLLFFAVQRCRGVIYKLNDSAYELMPPLFVMDDYDSCLIAPDGLYCVLQLQLHAGDDHLMTVIQEYSKFTTKHYNHTYIDRGVCVTKTCEPYLSRTTEGLEQVLEACLNESIFTEYGLQAKLSHLFYCNKHGEYTPIDTSDWVVAGVIGLVVLLNVVGSVYDYILQSTRKNDKKQNQINEDNKVLGNPYLMSFSVFQNYKWLVFKTKDPKLEWLHGLHGIRAIATFLMISAHIILIYCGYIDNTHDFEKSYDTTYFQLIVNGAVIIQLFFVISGMLLAYKMQIATEKNSISWWMAPKIILFRWLRLTPANALMVAFSATWLRHLGSGPLWRLAVTDSVAADCRAIWWRHLLYYNNYNMGGQGKFCAAHAWYVAADMQLFTLGVLVLMITRTRGRMLVLGLLMAAGVAAPAAHVFAEGLYGVAVLTPELYRGIIGNTFHHLHILGHNSISAFAVGMAIGYFFHISHITGKDYSKYRKFFRLLSYVAVPFGVLLIYVAGILFLEDSTPPLALRMAYQGLYRFIFSLVAASVGFALKFDNGGTFRRVVEWDGWIVPSRLSYCVYLLHIFFIYFLMGNKTQLAHMSFYNFLNAHLSVAALSFAVALPFCLMVEAPMIAIIGHCQRSMTSQGHPEVNHRHAEQDHSGVNNSRPEVNLEVIQGDPEQLQKVKNKY